ncbi:hypothetical protein KAS08_04840 [Candidatus Pacearchaeota archaeon]|nr:hypothetical protein [Candidatus Pacearchaeota archaeon]
MQKAIGGLFLVVILSSFVVASSIAVGFTIKDDSEVQLESYESSENAFTNCEIYLIGALLILIGAFTMLKSKNKKSVMIKKKLSSKKAPIGKKSVSKKK